MKVLFVVLDDETRASTRYRVLNFIPYLESAGIETEVISIYDIRDNVFSRDAVRDVEKLLEILIKSPNYDIVFLQKLLPNPLYTKLLDLRADQLMYDLDDPVYTAPPWGKNSQRMERNLKQVLSRVDHAITGSQRITEYVSEFTEDTHTLPTAIPKEPYETHKSEQYSNDGGVILGWIGNPENLHYLKYHQEMLERVLDKHSELRLRIITAGEMPVKPLKNRSGADVEYVEWSIDSELSLLSQTDIGIRPLTDDEWTRAKGGFTSVVQSMALGLPVVVTPVGMLNDIVVDDVTGRHATTAEEWISALSDLIEDPAKRRELGQRGHESLSDLGFWTQDRANEFIQALYHCADCSNDRYY